MKLCPYQNKTVESVTHSSVTHRRLLPLNQGIKQLRSYQSIAAHSALQDSVSKLAPTLLSVFASRLSKGRPSSPTPGSPTPSQQTLPMGQQSSKKSKKGGKD